MTRDLDFLIKDNDLFFEQRFHDFRVRKNGVVFTYSSNYFMLMNIMTYNIFKQYTLSDVYIENINDEIFVELLVKYSEHKYITLKDIKYILLKNNCNINLKESREKEWDFISFTKWIVLKS